MALLSLWSFNQSEAGKTNTHTQIKQQQQKQDVEIFV